MHAGTLQQRRTRVRNDVLALLTSTLVATASLAAPKSSDWPNVGNDKGGARYSTLTQINRTSVKDLQVAWTYNTGDADPKRGTTIECAPIVIDGVMYITTVSTKVVALNAETGKELWKFDPFAPGMKLSGPIVSGGVNRGVAYWTDGKGSERILLGAPDGRLISLDAKTGKPDPAFGTEGILDMREGLEGDMKRHPYGPTSPPAVFENLVIVGYSASEGPRPGAPGDVRAFDVRTGKQVWRFHTVPRPGEYGNETWPSNGWQNRSGVNAWGGYTVDEKRGIVFAGLGSAAFDFYGADRKGDNLFANSTIALDARTGKRLWHFQTLHHDLWDHDLPCPPVLGTIKQNGRSRDIAAQVTKTGFCYVFDRVTGKPIFDIEERPVPQSDVPGEYSAATQPVPVKPPPFARHNVGEEDVTDISPEARQEVMKLFRSLKAGAIFTPPSLSGTITVPGFHGGATWSGASFDPTTGYLYVNSNNMPNVTKITPPPSTDPTGYGFDGYNRFLDKDGYPGIKPPWGLLTAIDLNKGEFAWQVVLGEFPELTARGIPPTGTENFGGTIVTAGGLVFIGGTMDEKFHAFDKATGKLLWDFKLPAGGYATPCTYSVNGRQFVAIAAGGGGKLRTKSGDAFVAFALPNTRTAGSARR
jgi:quinoprotein glucose dehydrogenase